MIQRVVCFKFKTGTSETAIQQHMHDFKALEPAIPQIVTYAGGLAISAPVDPAPTYDSMHVMTFAALEDIDAYFYHPAHQQFITANRDIWESVLVLNAPTG